jgi:uncharacterized membrane protein YbhN (UPF0104 family)
MRKWFKPAAHALISACLAALVIRQIDLEQAAKLALRPHASSYLLAALLLFNLSKIVSAMRLNVYQRHAAIRLGEGENLRLYYAGMFLNLLLPGGISGDGYKILVLHRRQVAPVKTLLETTLTDRISGLLVLLALLCLLAPFVALPWTAGVVWLSAGAGLLMIAVVIALTHCRLLKMQVRRLACVCGYGLAVQILQLACLAMLLAYLRLPASEYLPFFAVFLVSSVAAVLPLSLGGLGAREITCLYGLQMLNLDPTPGVLACSGFFVITVASSLAGALCLGGFSAQRVRSREMRGTD